MSSKKYYPKIHDRHLIDINKHHPVLALRNELDRVFSDWLPFATGEKSTPFIPQVDFEDKGDKIVMHAELPGMKEDDIELSFDDDMICLRGEKKSEREEGSKKEGRYHYERTFGSFERVFPLPCKVEEDDIDASFKNGVLCVVLPKCKESLGKQKRISVRSE